MQKERGKMSKKKQKHGFFWWLFISWWWLPVKWVYFSIPAFIIRKILKALTSLKIPQKSKTAHTQPKSPAPPCDENVKTYHATGMEYRLENLLSIGIKNSEYRKSKKSLIEDGLIEEKVWEYEFYPNKVELTPEPDNPYDPNAIKVIVDGKHVAYIKKGSCAHLLKVIREGRIENIKCVIGGGNYKYIYEDDGDDWEDSNDWEDTGEPSYTLEKDFKNYFVWLYITEKE